jgi:hypothetical protein
LNIYLEKEQIMSIREFLSEANTDQIVPAGYKQEKPMSGEEIAKELGVTRQAISNSLKRAMKKAFDVMKKENKDMDAFEIAVMMATGWNAANSQAEYNAFFKLFPPAIRKEIENAAASRMGGRGIKKK